MSVNNVGSKRRRDPEEEEPGDGEVQPRVRIKTERELNDNVFEDEDSCGPPTPPVPRSTADVEEEVRPSTPPIPRVIVKHEQVYHPVEETPTVTVEDVVKTPVEPIPSTSRSHQTSFIISDSKSIAAGRPTVTVEDCVQTDETPEPTPSAPSTSRTQTLFPISSPPAGSRSEAGWSQPYVKSEPRRRNHDEPRRRNEGQLPNGCVVEVEDVEMSEENGAVGGGAANGEKNEDIQSRPSISSFFTFTASEQIQPGLPTAMTADIKPIQVARPQNAHYNSIRPEEELLYVEGGEKINTLPMFNGEKNEGSDVDSNASGDEKEEPEPLHQDGEKLTRYFEKNKVYTKYDFDSRKIVSSRLAVYEKRTHILNTLDKNRVVIIEGFTGCGKTTQVPQFIMDKCREQKSYCNIVVTQPRKIAAISVAKRVCQERHFQLGTVVGYQVGMEAKKDRDDTLITFMTTGVLLQKLISQRSLKEFTHIIIDEVHERDLESDFLLLIIKRIMFEDLHGKERHVKLILMSATIDTNKFERYFQFHTSNGDIRGPPVIKIPFMARHRVDEYYLDDLLHEKMDLLNLIVSNIDRDKATIQEDIYRIAVSCIQALDDIEKQSNPAEVDPRMRKVKLGPQKKGGAVLVFLPGMEEIKRLQRALEDAKRKRCQEKGGEAGDMRWAVFPLHSSVTAEDQNKIFDHPGDYFRKIILSTNIAESSVTVPDIESTTYLLHIYYIK